MPAMNLIPRHRLSNVLSAAILLAIIGCCTSDLLATTCSQFSNGPCIYDSYNRDGVGNNPSIYPTFTLSVEQYINQVNTYHWNYGSGQDPTAVGGWLGIYDLATSSFVIQQYATDLGIGPPNTNWAIYPNAWLPAGTYEIVDSDPSTWSYSTTDYFHLPGDGPDWQPYQGFAQVHTTPEPMTLVLLLTGALVPIVRKRRSNS